MAGRVTCRSEGMSSRRLLLDELQAAGVLAGDDEMYLQFDDRRQYLIFLFYDVGSEQALADQLRAVQQPSVPPALVDELVAAWRAGAKPMFSDPVHAAWRGARFEQPGMVEFLEVGLDILKLSRGSMGGAISAGRATSCWRPKKSSSSTMHWWTPSTAIL